ncbi:cytochrome P450 family 71 subfamily B polypeptide 23 [Euphorbia peplus]|nr:cytochrome P450 family 71 subfamily B polypeptide 23 [Euphorbia peplus]
MTTLTLIFLILIFRKLKNPTPKLPPGPWKLPLIGHMHHLLGCMPHQKMRDLSQKHGPMFHLQIGEVTNIIISSPEAAEQVMKTHGLIFAQRPQMSAAKTITYNYKDITFSPYGDYWRQLRKISTIWLLGARRVESYRSVREEETSKLVEFIISGTEKGEAVNITRMVSSLSYCITSRVAYGKIWEGEDKVVRGIEKMMLELGQRVSIADAFPSIKWLEKFSGINKRIDKIQEEVDPVIQIILNEHRSARLSTINKDGDLKGGKEDLVDVLLNLQENGDLEFPLGDDSIKALIMDVFHGGVDTAATTLEWTMSELMKNPNVMKKVQAELRHKYDARGKVDEEDLHELKYFNSVIKEGFRLHPPAPLLSPRECRESCVINGYDIPVKSRILINAWAMGRDPKYWDNPEEFKPERFFDNAMDYNGNNFEYLPFGAGRRICPGILFGLASVELPLAKLLYHFDWKLPDELKPENLDMTEAYGSTTKRKFNLCIIPIPYLPPSK